MKSVLTLIVVAYICCWLPAANAGERLRPIAQQDHTLKKAQNSRLPGSVMLPLSLPGSLLLDITLDFADVTDLSLLTAGISAAVISPVDIAVTSRFPAGDITIPADFPVLAMVEPPGVGLTTLAFDGTYEITLLTPNLPYFPGTKLRLFTAHNGGDFEDITYETSQGSYRVRGSGGTFSEFLIVLDNRAETDIIDKKIADLQALLSSYSGVIDVTVYASLDALLDSLDLSWTKGNLVSVKSDLDSFIATLIAATPAEIPDSWDATGGPDNVAGILRGKAATLKFSIDEYTNPSRRSR